MARTLTARVTELRSRSGLLDVLWRTVDEARIDGQRRLGAEITYYAFFSLFPLLMVFVTVIEAMFGKKTSEEIVKSVLGQFPVVGADIVDNIATPQGRGFAAAVGIVLALWAGSHAFESFEHAILVVWEGPGVAPIPYVKSRLWAFILMGILGRRHPRDDDRRLPARSDRAAAGPREAAVVPRLARPERRGDPRRVPRDGAGTSDMALAGSGRDHRRDRVDRPADPRRVLRALLREGRQRCLRGLRGRHRPPDLDQHPGSVDPLRGRAQQRAGDADGGGAAARQ